MCILVYQIPCLSTCQLQDFFQIEKLSVDVFLVLFFSEIFEGSLDLKSLKEALIDAEVIWKIGLRSQSLLEKVLLQNLLVRARLSIDIKVLH